MPFSLRASWRSSGGSGEPSTASRCPTCSIDLQVAKKRLEKKATFLEATNSLAQHAPHHAQSQLHWPDLLSCVARCRDLLKARHSNRAFWVAGQELFKVMQRTPLPAEDLQVIAQYLHETQAMLEAVLADEEREEAAASTPHTLADILLGTARVEGAPPHFDDTGPIVDEEEQWRRSQRHNASASASTSAGSSAAAAAAPADAPAVGSGAAAADGNAAAAPAADPQQARHAARARERAALQASILEGIQAVYSGMDAVTRGTEAVERELESIMAMLDRPGPGDRGSQPPPASKRVVRKLPKWVVDEAKLQELGPGVQCAVCTEELRAGDEVQVLPCNSKHVYHTPCLAPWLAKHNSCPVCRHELPTDDPQYEAAKERAVEEEAARRGAANATRGGELMYQ